jgi:parallel beta-helix repeat protein
LAGLAHQRSPLWSPHAAINVQRYAPLNAAPTHATVQGNTITGGGVGVRCTDAEADIEGNTITGAVTAISVDQNAVTIAGNSLSGLGGYGVQLTNGAVATVDDNEITDVASYGIIGFGSGSGSVVTNNRVTRSAGTAIGFDTGHVVTISDNILTDVGTGSDYGYGISVGAGVTDGTIRGNTINRCRGTGIIVHHGAVTTISDNELHDVWGPAAHGLQAWLAGATTFSGNEVTDCYGSGIQVSDSAAGPGGERAGVTISGNTVDGSGSAGVAVFSAGPAVVTSNHLANVALQGIVIGNAPSSRITGNTVVRPAVDGIKVWSGGSATIRANRVSDCGDVGLWAAST